MPKMPIRQRGGSSSSELLHGESRCKQCDPKVAIGESLYFGGLSIELLGTGAWLTISVGRMALRPGALRSGWMLINTITKEGGEGDPRRSFWKYCMRRKLSPLIVWEEKRAKGLGQELGSGKTILATKCKGKGLSASGCSLKQVLEHARGIIS